MSLDNSQLGEIHSLKATDYIVWLLEWTYTIFFQVCLEQGKLLNSYGSSGRE